MKRKPDQEALVSELRGASVFFPQREASPAAATTAVADRPSTSPPPPVTPTNASDEEVSQATESPVRTGVRTSVRRTLRRHPFEFYQDQLEALKQFSLTDQLNGERGSMSEMVREAVDEYISRRRHAQAEGPYGRTDGEPVRRTRPVGRAESRTLLAET